jgi:hypothetical protein
MPLFKILTVFIIISLVSFSLSAQSDTMTTDTIIKHRKPLLLSFGLDLKLKSIGGSYFHDYTGEFNSYSSGPGGWQWVNHNIADKDLLSYANFTEVKLSVLGSTSKKYKIGLSYNFGNVTVTIPEPNFDMINNPGQKTLYVNHSISYAGICVMGEYSYYFDQKSYKGIYAFGDMDLGFYTGTDDIFGPGTPWFIQGKLGIGYNLKNDVMLRGYIATDQLIYHENSISQVYHRTQTVDIGLSAFYVGIGIVKMFTIFPE